MITVLAFPKISGGRVTDCIFTPEGHINEIWITLDQGMTQINFVEDCIIEYAAKIHLNSIAGTVAK